MGLLDCKHVLVLSKKASTVSDALWEAPRGGVIR